VGEKTVKARSKLRLPKWPAPPVADTAAVRKHLNRFYPRSFLRLILIGFVLVALPLVVAVVSSILSIERLARQSTQAASVATSQARIGREIIEAQTGMERLLRQYMILSEPAILDDFHREHLELQRTTQRLADLALPAELQSALKTAMERERDLHDIVITGVLPNDVLDRFIKIAAALNGVVDRAQAYVDQAVDQVPRMADEARLQLLWQLLAAVPVALLIALWFKRTISNQISQLDHAIRSIGRAEQGENVTVTGTPDITYLGRRLDWLRRRLVELEEQKNRFLRHVSHDLKTPLTAVREGAQLLGDGVSGELNEEQRSIVAIISQNTRRLQRLIEDLLNFQQASYAASAIEPQSVAFDVICLKVLRTHRLAAAARGVKFRRELPAVLLDGDAEKLRVIVDNLITNAIKFTPSGKAINVLLHVNNDNAVLDVIDEGPGIADHDKEQIFDAFFRGTRTQRDERGEIMGSGLGLAIAKENVVAHRGQIELVKDELRTGAHFRVTLPLKWKSDQI
jgi:two-component system sensor histidine kinase GlrK